VVYLSDNAKKILDKYATMILRKSAVYEKDGVSVVNSAKNENYNPEKYNEDIVLWIPPKDCIRLEFENDRKENERIINELEQAAKSLHIMYCITDHGGKSEYFNIFNLKGIPVNEDNKLAKTLFIDLLLPANASKLDKSNLGYTFSPVIGHPHRKKKYNGAIHEITRGDNPLVHDNEYPNDLLKQIKKSKKVNKSVLIQLRQSSMRWVEDFLLQYCCTNTLPTSNRHNVIEKNLAILIVHRSDRDEIEKQYLDIQKQKNSSISSWYGGILRETYTIVNAGELANYIKQNNIDYEIPKTETQAQLDKCIIHAESVADDTTVILTDKKVFISKQRRDGKDTYSYDVIKGHFLPKRQLFLDNERVYEIETTRLFRGNAEEIMSFLKREGPIVSRNEASDAVNALLQGMKLPTVVSHATYGVYDDTAEEPNHLILCLEPYTRSDIQQQIEREINQSIKAPISKEQLQLWFSLIQYWHPYEILPAMALSSIASFGYVLRNKGITVPYLYHFSMESGIGKTLVIVIFTEDLFGKKKQSFDSINSSYRLADTLDSYGGLIGIDEAEKFPWEKYASHIQQAVESPYQDKRGTPHLGSRDYLSRATLAFTSNHFPIKRKALLVRLIKVEYDAKALEQRKDKKQIEVVDELRKKLKPIGWRLVELELQRIHSDISVLIKNVQGHASVFRSKLHRIEDSRRPLDWAVIYEGLKIWERAAEKFKIDWQAPTYDEFIDEVILPNEAATFESLELPAEDFMSWWQMWKVKNILRDMYDTETKGKGDVWCPKTLKYNDVDYIGDVVTNSVIQEYVKEKQTTTTTPINNLATLGKAISSMTDLPYELVYKVWKGGDFKISTKGTFIPHAKYDIDDFICENIQQCVDIIEKNIDSKKTAVEEIRKFMDHFKGEIDDVRFYKIAKDLVIFIKQLISEPEVNKKI